jgi:hypothetical protein
MLGMCQQLITRIKVAACAWPSLRSGRHRLAMVAWVIGLTESAALLMRL